MAFSSRTGGRVRADINVTPLVDVVLVLIIFLVAMPLVMAHFDVEVPRPPPEGTANDSPQAIIVELGRGEVLRLSGVEINRTDLAPRLREALQLRRQKVVFVDVDGDIRYGTAVALMDTVKGAGAETLAVMVKR